MFNCTIKPQQTSQSNKTNLKMNKLSLWLDKIQAQLGSLASSNLDFNRYIVRQVHLRIAGLEPPAIRLKAQFSTNWAIHPLYINIVINKDLCRKEHSPYSSHHIKGALNEARPFNSRNRGYEVWETIKEVCDATCKLKERQQSSWLINASEMCLDAS